MDTLKQLTEEEFDKQFSLLKNPFDNNASFEGCMFETYGKELDYVTEMAKQNRVITIIDSCGDDREGEEDDDGFVSPVLYYTSGMHRINRLGFLITKEPITFDFEVKIE